jgi:hypothetical protein
VYPDNGEGPDAWYAMVQDAQASIAAMQPPTSKVWVTEVRDGDVEHIDKTILAMWN